MPELKEIPVSRARKIASVITAENKEHWLTMAKQLTRLELEKEIVKVSPREATQERVGYVTESRVEVRLGLDEKALTDLKWAQDQVSQSKQSHATLEDTLIELLKFYRSKKDLTKKVSSSGPGRKVISNTRKLALARDGYRCTNTRWLDVHHIIHKQHGGSDELENLTTLCNAHHRQHHSATIPPLYRHEHLDQYAKTGT